MNTYAILFATIIVTVHGTCLLHGTRQVDDGSGAPPTIEIQLDGQAATSVDEGIIETSQDASASAVGTVANPAVISFVADIESDIEQESFVDQVAIGNHSNLSSTSYNLVLAENLGFSGDHIFGSATGGQSAAMSNIATGLVTGSGVITAGTNASSSNVINP
ncbi:unnamed protein product [Orchesella dallaii]|uniref:Uncharacterized protein n=1 Tax=Orchesella dallaii TaxID=48710 RepID=A0ABP1RQY9_9HEXA